MTPTQHDARIQQLLMPMLKRSVQQALHALSLAQLHLKVQGAPEAALWALRLAPDMLCLAHQVQVLADGVRGALAHLRGDLDDPCAGWVFNRGESDLPPPLLTGTALTGLLHQARIAIEQQPDVERIAWHTRRHGPVRVERPGLAREFGTDDFLWGLVLTNVSFHSTMIHALLRHGGVPLGKADYVGQSPWASSAQDSARDSTRDSAC